MADINYNRTLEADRELHSVITRRVTKLERDNYKKKKYKGPEIQKRIKRIIEEEVSKA